MNLPRPEQRTDSGFDRFMHGFADALDPAEVDAEVVTEAGTVEYARAVLAGELTTPTRVVSPDLPPLYEPGEEGEWCYNGHSYTVAEAQAWIQAELHRCRTEPFYFITHYCWTINAHLDGEEYAAPTVDLIPDWPHIRALVNALFPARDVIIEKSRDMMASWIGMAACLHDLCFQWNWPVMTLSYVEKLVDDGGENATVASLHGKFRFLRDNLPPFLRDAHQFEFKHLIIRNVTTGSHMWGFSSNPRAGRGPKWKRVIGDEFAFQRVLRSDGYAASPWII